MERIEGVNYYENVCPLCGELCGHPGCSPDEEFEFTEDEPTKYQTFLGGSL